MGIAVRHLAQFVDHRVDSRQQHLFSGGLQLQSMAGVVDVFAGTGEMDEFIGLGQLFAQCSRQTGQLALLFEPILHRLHIVVGGALNRFDGHAVLGRKRLHQVLQMGPCSAAQRLELCHARIAQSDKPSHLDLNAALHKAVLAHEQLQRLEFVGVTPIQGRQGGHSKSIHMADSRRGLSCWREAWSH